MGQTSQHSYSGDVDAVCNVCSYTRTIVVTEPTEETEETVALMEKTEPTVEATVTETVKATELSNGDDEIPFGEDTPKKPGFWFQWNIGCHIDNCNGWFSCYIDSIANLQGNALDQVIIKPGSCRPFHL